MTLMAMEGVRGNDEMKDASLSVSDTASVALCEWRRVTSMSSNRDSLAIALESPTLSKGTKPTDATPSDIPGSPAVA